MRILVIGLVAMGLVACETVQPSIPSGYTGPTAVIKDSFQSVSPTQVSVFYLEGIDGRSVDNALKQTLERNRGRGSFMTPQGAERPVPARDAAFHVVGVTHYAAPILELANTIYIVEGVVHLSPLDGGAYVVKGELGADHCAVWIEDEKTGAQVGNKLLAKGPSEIAAFKKRPPVVEVPPGS
jgi:hypothetical protein